MKCYLFYSLSEIFDVGHNKVVQKDFSYDRRLQLEKTNILGTYKLKILKSTKITQFKLIAVKQMIQLLTNCNPSKYD